MAEWTLCDFPRPAPQTAETAAVHINPRSRCPEQNWMTLSKHSVWFSQHRKALKLKVLAKISGGLSKSILLSQYVPCFPSRQKLVQCKPQFPWNGSSKKYCIYYLFVCLFIHSPVHLFGLCDQRELAGVGSFLSLHGF